MKELTERQEEILGYLGSYKAINDNWPSIRNIQEQFRFKSTNAVMGHLRALERKGHIVRIHGQARSFRLKPSATSQAALCRAGISADILDIPIFGSIAAGYPDGIEPGDSLGRLQIDSRTGCVESSNSVFALKVRGDSMVEAGIFDGDLVILHRASPRSGDIVAALIDNETTLKRFVQEPGKNPFLKAENRAYPKLFPVQELIIQGVAKSIIRSL